MTAALQERRYLRSEGVVFCKTREAFGELSNMASGYPLCIAGIIIPSTEALYQSCRFPHLPEVQRLIIAQKSPMTAKMVSKPYRDQSRDDWDDVRVAIMKWCLRVKLLQHWDRFSAVLRATGDKPIVELSRKDPFWGAIPLEGQQVLVGANVLGRLLMELRSARLSNASDLDRINPVPIENFVVLGRPIDTLVRPGAVAPPKLRLVHSAEPKVAPARPPEPKSSPPKKTSAKKAGEAAQLLMLDLPRQRRQTAAHPVYSVIASEKGGWDVRKHGARRASGHFETKLEATARGRELAKKQKASLCVYDKSGKLQECKAA